MRLIMPPLKEGKTTTCAPEGGRQKGIAGDYDVFKFPVRGSWPKQRKALSQWNRVLTT